MKKIFSKRNIIIFGITFFIAVPLFLEYLIFRNKVYSVVSNETWGSIYASLIGSFFSFIVAVIALKISHDALEVSKKGGNPDLITGDNCYFRGGENGYKGNYLNIYNVGKGFAKNIKINFLYNSEKSKEVCDLFGIEVEQTNETFISLNRTNYIFKKDNVQIINFMPNMESIDKVIKISIPEFIFELYQECFKFLPMVGEDKEFEKIKNSQAIIERINENPKKYNEILKEFEQKLIKINEILRVKINYYDLNNKEYENIYDVKFDGDFEKVYLSFCESNKK